MTVNSLTRACLLAGFLPASALLAQVAGAPPGGTAELDIGAMLQPVPLTAKFIDPDYYIWCGTMVRGDDGKCHLFYSRWPRKLGHCAWVTHSEVAHAVADTPLGAFRHVDVALPARGAAFWDGLCTHNPTVRRFGSKFYLYYMGNTGDGVAMKTLNWTHRNNQRIGVAVADSPNGPWQRFDQPVIAPTPGFLDALCCANPSVTDRVGGGYLMVYKAVGDTNKLPFGGPVLHAVAFSDSPTGPFRKQPKPVFKKEGVAFAAEDPFIWTQDSHYWAIVKDNAGYFTQRGKGTALFESSDGLDWKLAKHALVATTEITWEAGHRQKLNSLERPQLFLENGKPSLLLFACDEDGKRDHSFNIRVPLKAAADMKAVVNASFAALLCASSGLGATDLIGRWAFEGCDGKVAKDLSGCGNDGAITDGALRPEKSGASLELDGIDGHVLIDLKTPLDLRTNITVTLWVKAARVRNNTVLFGIPNPRPDWTTPAFGMYLSGGRVVYGQHGDGKTPKVLLESKAELPKEQWTCLAATSDGSVLRLYVNGALDAELAKRAVVALNGNPLLIGKGFGDKPSLKGRVGELSVYGRALSGGEIRALFDSSKSAYDLAPPAAGASAKDGTVIVETHGNNPELDMPWRAQPTRLLELLDGYKPSSQPVPVNRYGGRTDRPREQATGFFHTQKIDGRWWLIDPEGCRFYHVAINTVREPKEVKVNFGSSGQWAEAVSKQLREAGFNGLGNSSSTNLQHVAQPLVWVLRHNFIFAFAREKNLVEAASGTQGFPNRCMPVFHPEFPAFCEAYGKALAATANDPTMLGIMTENELQCPVDLLDRYLASDASNPDLKPGRDAAEAWLTARKGSLDLKSLTRRDRYEFIAYAFGRYYSIVTPIVRKHDPNHLYLGSRINYSAGQFDNPWFWKVLAPTHDVVSVNYYGRWGPQADEFADWAAWADRPVLITEWYAKAMDVEPRLANTHGAGWLVRTQEDRARYYQHFALNALETKNIVGWHFFKYLDDPPESKALDNMGGANKGMFDAKGKPHQPVLDRARAVNREVYPLIEFFDQRR